MRLSDIKLQLKTLAKLSFQLPNGTLVPQHFHVTEVGVSTKNFIDCGGIIWQENVLNFQLWHADDVDHLLKPKKLLKIIVDAEKTFEIPDYFIEVEFQGETIEKYDLDFDGEYFLLLNKKTACLAKNSCGIPADIENQQDDEFLDQKKGL